MAARLPPVIVVAIVVVMGVMIVYATPPLGKSVVSQTGESTRSDAFVLRGAEVTESSGLAHSRRDRRCVWTHNDSGGAAVVYAFDRDGNPTGRLKLALPRKPFDWEDMAAFTVDGKPRLVVADCGDNAANRSSIQLHFVDEPDPHQTTVVRPAMTLSVVYPDGPQDCEAIAVDPRSGRVLLFTKSFLPSCGVYSVAIPAWPVDANDASTQPRIESVKAVKQMTLTIPLITAADVDSVTGDLMLVGYFQGYRYRRRDATESIETMLRRLPDPVTLPSLKQIEAMAFDDTGQAWVTSEGDPAPVQRLVTDAQSPGP